MSVREQVALWRAAEAMRHHDTHPTLMSIADALESHAAEHLSDCQDPFCRGLMTLAEGYLAWADSRGSA